LTSGLLAFARRQPLKPEPIDIYKAVASIENMLHSALRVMIRVEIVFDAEMPVALADAKQLDLALLNVAINSRDAMPNGGAMRITTGCETAVPPTRPEHPPTGDYVVISVTDTGIGIAPELLGRIFEPFFTTKEPGRGSGLGLSHVLGFVQQSGGGIRVDSRLGVGTTIKLYLPKAPSSSSVTETAQEPLLAASIDRPLSVLVVDDDAFVRTATAAMLEELGHRVIAVESGGAALDVLARGKVVDAALLDYAMPEMSGGELAERARRLRPELPILFMTGFAEPEGLWEANAHGVVLRKPFKAGDLAVKLAQIAGRIRNATSPRSARADP
jgi:CheY-like chemotaxis protein